MIWQQHWDQLSRWLISNDLPHSIHFAYITRPSAYIWRLCQNQWLSVCCASNMLPPDDLVCMCIFTNIIKASSVCDLCWIWLDLLLIINLYRTHNWTTYLNMTNKTVGLIKLVIYSSSVIILLPKFSIQRRLHVYAMNIKMT